MWPSPLLSGAGKGPGLMLGTSDCPSSDHVFISEPFVAMAVKHFVQAQVTWLHFLGLWGNTPFEAKLSEKGGMIPKSGWMDPGWGAEKCPLDTVITVIIAIIIAVGITTITFVTQFPMIIWVRLNRPVSVKENGLLFQTHFLFMAPKGTITFGLTFCGRDSVMWPHQTAGEAGQWSP